jgi:hypothetical protein
LSLSLSLTSFSLRGRNLIKRNAALLAPEKSRAGVIF